MNDDIVTRLRRDCMSLIADEAADEIERLRAERDEARMMYCTEISSQSRYEHCTPKWVAEERGWDCFKERR